MTPFCAAVDWGTSSFRLWLLARDGRVLAERRSDEGMMAAREIGFAAVLDRHLAAVEADSALPVVVCGMAGARQGWREAAYLDAPAQLSAVTAHAIAVEHGGRPIRILPGICQRDPSRPDVMRGEETKLLGAGIGGGASVACIPGTHSKWVELRDGRLQSFHTSMTGDAFAALSGHTVLRLTIGDAPEVDAGDPVFRAAVRLAAARPQELMFQSFAVRAGPLLDLFDARDGAARLSGLLIGLEIAGARSRLGDVAAVSLIAAGRFASLYRAALDEAGIGVRPVDADAAVRDGLHRAALSLWGTS